MRTLPNPVKFWVNGSRQAEHTWPPAPNGQWCYLRIDQHNSIMVSAVVWTSGKADLVARFESIVKHAEACLEEYRGAMEGLDPHCHLDFHHYRLRRWRDALQMLKDDKYTLEPLDPSMMVKAHWASNDEI